MSPYSSAQKTVPALSTVRSAGLAAVPKSVSRQVELGDARGRAGDSGGRIEHADLAGRALREPHQAAAVDRHRVRVRGHDRGRRQLGLLDHDAARHLVVAQGGGAGQVGLGDVRREAPDRVRHALGEPHVARLVEREAERRDAAAAEVRLAELGAVGGDAQQADALHARLGEPDRACCRRRPAVTFICSGWRDGSVPGSGGKTTLHSPSPQAGSGYTRTPAVVPSWTADGSTRAMALPSVSVVHTMPS